MAQQMTHLQLLWLSLLRGVWHLGGLSGVLNKHAWHSGTGRWGAKTGVILWWHIAEVSLCISMIRLSQAVRVMKLVQRSLAIHRHLELPGHQAAISTGVWMCDIAVSA